MKTKMHTQNRITKFTNSSFKSLIMLALVFISFGMYGQIPMPWGNSDYTVTGGTDDYGGFIGTLIQANNDGSNNPEENIYFRVGLTSGNRWFYYPQMVVARDKIYLNEQVQLTKSLVSKSYISASGSLFSETGDVVSKAGNIFTLQGDLYSKKGNIYTELGDVATFKGSVYTSEGNLFSNKGNLYTNIGDLFSKKGHIYTESGDVATFKGSVYTSEGNLFSNKGNLYTNIGDLFSKKGHIYTESGDVATFKGSVYTSEGNLFSKKGNIFTNDGYIKANQGFQTTGYLYAAGKVFLGGNFDATGTAGDPSTFYKDQALLTKYSVFVQEGLLSEDYALAPQENWADYVFTKEHVLKPLKEVDHYIQENGNLPNIPSATQIAKDGYNLHEMNVKFLEKIEELTLYTIAQQKSIDEQHLAIVRLEQQVQELLSGAKK